MKVDKITPFPSIWEAIGMTFLIILFLYVFTFVAFLIIPNDVPQTIIFLGSYTMAMCCSILLFLKLRKDRNTNSALLLFQKIDIKIALLITVATLGLNNGITMILTDFIPISESSKEALINNFGNLDGFMLVALIIGAPIFEEYLFRGIMLDGLLKKYDAPVAIVVSSILFGIMHLNSIQFISAMIDGFFLGWIYYKSKNLSYCMLIHFVVNLTGYIFITRFGIERMFGEGIVNLYGGTGIAIMIFIIAILIFAACLWTLNQLFETDKNIT